MTGQDYWICWIEKMCYQFFLSLFTIQRAANVETEKTIILLRGYFYFKTQKEMKPMGIKKASNFAVGRIKTKRKTNFKQVSL
jgi:hypothetical protein